ncbi:MAG: uracil-xanthine permease, partial [Oscillospiraceae bacterium]|nr:uracil-xanthine permease [Oscillospiraceae bacterium]
GCVAITRNASVATITATAIISLLISFISPVVAFLDSIPGCVLGGVCITLSGFIAVSGIKMIQKVDLEQNKNLFTVSVILIAGIGGMAMAIGKVTLTSIACALILGIIVNIVVSKAKEGE